MISFIRGKIWEVDGDTLTIEMSGMGINVFAPSSTMTKYPQAGDEIFLYTHLQIREDAWQLYGFIDKEQLRVFRMLLNISGIGAKTALAIVDSVSISRFAAAITAQDITPFTAVSGVGKKTAQRLLLELKDKFSSADILSDQDGAVLASLEINSNLVFAMKQLGYTAVEARAYAFAAQNALGAEANEEELLRYALKQAYKN